MYREAIKQLSDWRSQKNRKPLIINGARQVGKTWLMKEFAKNEYQNLVYINFENDPTAKDIFDADFNTKRIIKGLEIISDQSIVPHTTLIVFDEIQEAPKALTALKYFQEESPEYDIIGAGSLLGVALHANTSFPVGKVSFLNLYPMSFSEFLTALGETRLLNLLRSMDWEMIRTFSEQLTELLRQYYFIGGMPEAIASFIREKDYDKVRKIQLDILSSYERDFSKYASAADVTRIRMIWNSVPAQLAKENKKFIYGILREGARAKTYETALTWLKDCGLIHQVFQVNKPQIPLKAFEIFNAFKIYLVDLGLLGAMTSIDKKILIEKNSIFQQFKGAMTEQYVLQQLKTLDKLPIYYWSAEGGRAEVDFLIQTATDILPIEAKAEENLQAKSLAVFAKKFNNSNAIRTSMSHYRDEGWMKNIPLYALPFYIESLLS